MSGATPAAPEPAARASQPGGRTADNDDWPKRWPAGLFPVGRAKNLLCSAGDELVGPLVRDAEELADISQGEATLVEFPGGGSDLGGGGGLGLG